VGGVVEIASGVSPGQRLVRRPPPSLSDGSPIKEKKK
jgi:hypothetical protein